MNWQTPIIVCVASLALLGWQAPDCAPPVPPNKSVPVKEIEPGNYRVRLIATHGSKTGSAVTGSLWLRRTGAGDVSPTTGDKPPREEDRRRIPCMARWKLPLSWSERRLITAVKVRRIRVLATRSVLGFLFTSSTGTLATRKERPY
jgi:hypothetical protein